MSSITLNQLAQVVHKANEKWWVHMETGERLKRNKGELLALVHSEISEAQECYFSGSAADDKLPHRCGVEVELADAFIRLLDYAAGFGYEIGDADASNLNVLDDKSYWEWRSTNPMRLGQLMAWIHVLISRVLECERKGNTNGALESLCDVICTIAWCSRLYVFDLQGAFTEKMAYNAKREDHKHEARKIAGGKQF